jgi:calcineurin-like phosphoesterase family protein
MTKTFVVSDLHLGHFNIIKYSNRPFKSLEEMNNTLISNWNSIVSPKDNVFFLGDLAFGKNTTMDIWLSKLNGNIIFIEGNHDHSNNIPFIKYAVVTFDNVPFLLVHNPNDIPSDWSGWVIHGHHHNNHPEQYPFINPEWKTFNVSVEWTEYKPVNVETLVQLVRKNDVKYRKFRISY